MKKLTLIILLSIFCFGFSIQDAHKKVIARNNDTVVSDACSSCPDATAGADIICEDWEDNELCSWTGAASGWDDDHAIGGTYACTDKGTYDLLVSWDYDTDSSVLGL